MNPKLIIRKCFEEGISKYPFWAKRKNELLIFLSGLLGEVSRLNDAARRRTPISRDLAGHIKAVWCISGSGSYLKKALDTPGDRFWLGQPWALGTDKKRLDHAVRLIKEIKAKGGFPVLVYNGTSEQNEGFRSVAQKKLGLSKGQYFICEGNIIRTIDQVKGFCLPDDFAKKSGGILGIVSHSAHLVRVMRMANKYKVFPKNMKIMLFPLVFSTERQNTEFTVSEIMGILGYIEKGQCEIEPAAFSLIGDRMEDDVKISAMTKDDLLNVFHLSNQPSVRAVSFNQDKIKLKDHRIWFAKKLGDKNTVLLKAEDLGKFAGQIRLDINGAKAVLSISVDERHRGKGIASMLIKAAIAAVKRKKLSRIEALTKSDNLASQKLLEKNGFIFKGEKNVDGVGAKEYSLILC